MWRTEISNLSTLDTRTEALGIISEAADRNNDRIKELVRARVCPTYCLT